ncbi:hypothetical protein DEO72_LG3g1124 [Vigna unguiculata]|uniref:Uncharacterized protein n=1 Tax=Vigna unguiculata TaxID=3917 RepID=A0A4D6LDM6_VIGUN|nr:hypothetical protein DEO72_LG3g1124 [Vigna unguiculata]
MDLEVRSGRWCSAWRRSSTRQAIAREQRGSGAGGTWRRWRLAEGKVPLGDSGGNSEPLEHVRLAVGTVPPGDDCWVWGF